jgi:hypothetical protein
MDGNGPDKSPVNPYQSPLTSPPVPKRDRGLLAMIGSFLLISVAGCIHIWVYWMSRSRLTGLIQCVAFVAIMGGVHFIGIRLWRRQQEANALKREEDTIEAQTDRRAGPRELPYGTLWALLLLLLLLLLVLLMML